MHKLYNFLLNNLLKKILVRQLIILFHNFNKFKNNNYNSKLKILHSQLQIKFLRIIAIKQIKLINNNKMKFKDKI